MLIVWFLPLQSAEAFEIRDPGLSRNEVAVYRTLKDGKELDVRKEIRLDVKEQEYDVTFSMIDDSGRSDFTTVFARGEVLEPVRYFRQKLDPAGNATLTGDIKLAGNPHYPRDTCPLFGNTFAFRSLIRHQPAGRIAYTCLFPGGSKFILFVRVQDPEQVRTPAGIFDCLRIEETLDMKSVVGGMFGSLLRVFPVQVVPKTCYWVDRKPPYLLIRREGVAGPPPHDTMVIDEMIHREG